MKEGATMWDHFTSLAGAAAQEVVEVGQWTDSISIGFSSLLPGVSCAGPAGGVFEVDEELIEASALFEAREPLLVRPHDTNPVESISDDEDLSRGDDTSDSHLDSPNEVSHYPAQPQAEARSNLRAFQPERQPVPDDLLEFSDDFLDPVDNHVAVPSDIPVTSTAPLQINEPNEAVFDVATTLEPLIQFEPEKKVHDTSESLLQLEPEKEAWDVPPLTAAAGA